MNLSSRDRLGHQDIFQDVRGMSRMVTLCIPRLAPTNLDPDTGSGLDIQDGNGSGYTVVDWEIYRIHAHVRDVTQALLAYGPIPAGLQVGDVFFSVNLRDKDTIRRGYTDQHAYIDIDGKKWRITGLDGSGVGQVEEAVVSCRATNPRYRAPGL